MDPDWKNLPKHLLDSVVERLVLPSDYLRFSLVCKSWYGIAKDNEAQLSKMTIPMLLIATDIEDTWNLYDVMENKVFDVEISMPNKRYCGCSKGWLITVEKNFAVTLINPFFRIKGSKRKQDSIIPLPPLPPPSKWWALSEKYDHYVFRSTISADPILDTNNCVVVVIYEEANQMAFIRLGKDPTWTLITEMKWRLIEEVIHFGDRFYAVDHWSKFLRFKITAPSSPDIEVLRQHIGIEHGKKYLMILNEKQVLMVRRYFEYEDEDALHGQRVTTGFKIFEFNFDECEWIEKNSLGDVALFLGDNCSISVPISISSEFQSNCIYFNHDIDHDVPVFEHTGCHHSSDFGVYNVNTRSISQPYSTHATTLVKNTKCPPIWVVPTFQL